MLRTDSHVDYIHFLGYLVCVVQITIYYRMPRSLNAEHRHFRRYVTVHAAANNSFSRVAQRYHCRCEGAARLPGGEQITGTAKLPAGTQSNSNF